MTLRISQTLSQWSEVRRVLEDVEPGAVLRVAKSQLPHPLDSRAHLAVGLPVGQRADYVWKRKRGPWLRVRDMGDTYEAELVSGLREAAGSTGKKSSAASPEGPSSAAAGAALGAVIGGFLGADRKSFLAGAGIGAILGAILGGAIGADEQEAPSGGHAEED